MNQEIKDKWLERLRSTKDKHASYCFRTHNNRFCAVGALIDLLRPNSWKISNSGYEYEFNGSTCAITPEAIPEAGLTQGQIHEVMGISDRCQNYDLVIKYIEGL